LSIAPICHTFNGGSTEELLRIEYHDSRDSRIALLEYKNVANSSNDDSEDVSTSTFFPWCETKKQQFLNMLVEADRSEHEKLLGFRLLTVLRKWRDDAQQRLLREGSSRSSQQNPSQHVHESSKFGLKPPSHHERHLSQEQQQQQIRSAIASSLSTDDQSRDRTISNASSVGSIASNGQQFNEFANKSESDNRSSTNGLNNVNDLVSLMTISDDSKISSDPFLKYSRSSVVGINSLGLDFNPSNGSISGTSSTNTNTETFLSALSVKNGYNNSSHTNSVSSNTPPLPRSNFRAPITTNHGSYGDSFGSGSGSLSAPSGGNALHQHHHNNNSHSRGLNLDSLHGKGMQSLKDFKGIKQNQFQSQGQEQGGYNGNRTNNSNLYVKNSHSHGYNGHSLPLSNGNSTMVPHYMSSRNNNTPSLLNGNDQGSSNSHSSESTFMSNHNNTNNNLPTPTQNSMYNFHKPPHPSHLQNHNSHNGHNGHNGGHARNDRDNNNNMSNDGGQLDYALDYSRIAMGVDRRTTIMIRNIPNKYSQQLLLNEINAHYVGCYDFFYLPIDFKNKCNVGYAFINFMDPLHILDFFKEFNGTRWRNFNSEKVCSLSYARIQGKQAMIARFQNSSLLDKDDEFRPLLFISSGVQKGQPEPFPLPSVSYSHNHNSNHNNHGSYHHSHSHHHHKSHNSHNSNNHGNTTGNIGMGGILNINMVSHQFGSNSNSNITGTSNNGSYSSNSRNNGGVGQQIPLHHLHSYRQHQQVLQEQQLQQNVQQQAHEQQNKNQYHQMQPNHHRQHLQQPYNNNNNNNAHQNRFSSSSNTIANSHFQHLP
jgi:hypothetical protein